jgi:hypothetical protein
MGRKCSTYGEEEGREHYENLNIVGRKILRFDLGEIGWNIMNRIHVAHDRDKYRVLVATVTDLRLL